jgi:dTDP-4-dehydrorhamnose 3,5-epimerase
MKFTPLEIPEIILIEPSVFEDERGFFLEVYDKLKFLAGGVKLKFVQENHSGSEQGVLRGMHYQRKFVQGKLIRVIAGEVFDVAVDVRKSSPTFKSWVGVRLSQKNKHQLWIPPGFAHGFYVLSAWAEVVYKVTNYYAP